MDKLTITRKQAALKGWETRRDKAKKRSDASRKGWKTRRQKMQEAHTDPLGWECVEGG